MIIEDATPGPQMLTSGIACFIGSSAVSLPPPSVMIDFCTCDYECEYYEYAFYDEGLEDYKNDFTSVIAQLLDPAGTIEFFLVNKSGTETPLIDNTYGTYFDFGNRKGFKTNWLLIKNAFGIGQYKLKTVVNNFGREVIQETHYFFVTKYDEITADGTVRIDTTNKGLIYNGFDYRDIEWDRRIRVPGKFWRENPTPELDDYENTDRVIRQIQDKIRTEVNLDVELAPASVIDNLVYNDFLMNDLFITNYDVFNYKQYRSTPVRLKGIEEPTYYNKNTKSFNTYTFEINDGGIIKRNI